LATSPLQAVCRRLAASAIVMGAYASPAMPSPSVADPLATPPARRSIKVRSAHPRQEAPEFASSKRCARFDLSTAQVAAFLRWSNRISRETFDHARDWLPCVVEGEATIAGVDVRYAISATLIGRLTSATEQATFVECRAACRKSLAAAARATPLPTDR
jgi:hypothetical protein